MPKLLDVYRERFQLACMDIKEIVSAGHPLGPVVKTSLCAVGGILTGAGLWLALEGGPLDSPGQTGAELAGFMVGLVVAAKRGYALPGTLRGAISGLGLASFSALLLVCWLAAAKPSLPITVLFHPAALYLYFGMGSVAAMCGVAVVWAVSLKARRHAG